MNEKKSKILLIGYLVVILFCMFFGFGRISGSDSFQYSFTITGIPLWFPKHFSLDSLQRWIFALGNLVAFIPFGVLIPINLQKAKNLFLKSFAAFLISITVLETVQMFTLLGSFDMEDILINTLGFLIGYISWKFSRQGNKLSDKILRFCIVCIVLVIALIIGAEFVNPFLRQIPV